MNSKSVLWFWGIGSLLLILPRFWVNGLLPLPLWFANLVFNTYLLYFFFLVFAIYGFIKQKEIGWLTPILTLLTLIMLTAGVWLFPLRGELDALFLFVIMPWMYWVIRLIAPVMFFYTLIKFLRNRKV